MRRCEYCGHENNDEASSCCECNTKFLVPTFTLRSYEPSCLNPKPVHLHAFLQKHASLVRVLSVLSLFLAACLLWVTVRALPIAYMLLTGQGPGGLSGVGYEEALLGWLALVIAVVSCTAGCFCMQWAFRAWHTAKEVRCRHENIPV
jgi:hypothetical protein